MEQEDEKDLASEIQHYSYDRVNAIAGKVGFKSFGFLHGTQGCSISVRSDRSYLVILNAIGVDYTISLRETEKNLKELERFECSEYETFHFAAMGRKERFREALDAVLIYIAGPRGIPMILKHDKIVFGQCSIQTN
jgi:hypothetical protein